MGRERDSKRVEQKGVIGWGPWQGKRRRDRATHARGVGATSVLAPVELCRGRIAAPLFISVIAALPYLQVGDTHAGTA